MSANTSDMDHGESSTEFRATSTTDKYTGNEDKQATMNNILMNTASNEHFIHDNVPKRVHESVPSSSSIAVETSTKDESSCDTPDEELNKKKNNNIKVKGTGELYDGGGSKNTQHGINYQTKLPMLYIVRGLKLNEKFELANEVKDAEKFDDLLILYENEIGFYQAKHKTDVQITISEEQLLAPGGDFSIPMYFRSYIRILKTFENVLNNRSMTLILSTNIDIDKSVKGNFQLASSRFNEDNKILKLASEMEKNGYICITENSSSTSLYQRLLNLLLGQILEQPPIRMAQHFAKAVLNYKCNKTTFDRLFEENREWLLAYVFEVVNEDNETQNIDLIFRESFVSDSQESISNFRKAFVDTCFPNKIKKGSSKGEQSNNLENVEQYLLNAKFQVPKRENTNEMANVTQDDVKKFLNVLVFAVNQPNEIALDEIIEKEIGEYVECNDTQSITSKFKIFVQDWAYHKPCRYLTHVDMERQFAIWIQETYNQTRMSDIEKFRCTFGQCNKVIKNLSNFLTGNDANVLFLYSRQTVFSKIKVRQVLESFVCENYGKQFVFCDIDDLIEAKNGKNCPLKAFSSQTCDVLYVSLPEGNIHEIDILNKLFQIVIESKSNAGEPYSVKRLIISIPEKEKREFSKKNSFNTPEITIVALDDFDNSFKDLDETSRLLLMNEPCIKLHGNNMTGLLSENDLLYIRDEMLFNFISSGIEISEQALVTDDYNKEVKEYYVNRLLVPIIVVQDVTKDPRFHFVHDNIDNTPQMNIKHQNQEVVIVSSNEKLFEHFCKVNDNVHWLKERDNKYIWITSQGTLTNLRKYVAAKDSDLDRNTNLDLCLDLDSGLDSDSDFDSDFGPNLDSNYDSDLDFDSDPIPYLDLNPVPDLEPDPEPDANRDPDNCIPITKVCNLKNDVVLISANPGTGKSILLSHIAEQSKEENTSFFVFKTNLARNCKLLRTLKKEGNVTLKQAIHFTFITTQIESLKIEEGESIFNDLKEDDGILTFSSDARFNEMNRLRAAVFCKLYNEGRIVLLLDGFDEIAPTYCEITLNLLQTLRDSMVRKIWITTRPYGITKRLENVLETFAYSLKPLSKDEHLTLVKKFWGHKIKNTETLSSVGDFLNSLNTSTLSALHEAETNQNPNERSPNFMSVPLHSTMLAKVLTNDLINFAKKMRKNDIVVASNAIEKPLTIFDLYKKFFDIKFDEILYDGQSNDPKYEEFLEPRKKEVETDLGKLALLELFDEKLLLELVEDRSRLLNDVEIGKEKTGYVAEVVDEKPRYLHRTYAEYFAAHYLATILLGRVENKRKEAAKSLLYYCVTGNSEYYYLLFTFFNYVVVSNSKYKDFFEAAIVGNVRKLSEIGNVNEMFDPLNRTPMHLLAIGLFNVLKNIQNVYQEADKATSEIYDIFIRRLGESMVKLSTDSLFRWTPKHYLTLCPNKSNSENFPVLTQYLNDGTLDTLGRTPLMLLILNHSFSIRWIKQSLPFNLTCVNTQDHYYNTALHYALKNFKKYIFSEKRNRKSVISIWEEYLEIICFLLKHNARIDLPNSQGITPLHMINSIVTKDTKHILKRLSIYQKCKLDECDHNYIHKILKKFITGYVEKNGYNAFSFEVDEDNTPDHVDRTAPDIAVEQKDSNSVQNLSTQRLKSNINFPLMYTLLRQLLRDSTLPTLHGNDGEAFNLFFINMLPLKISELLRPTQSIEPLREPGREAFFEKRVPYLRKL